MGVYVDEFPDPPFDFGDPVYPGTGSETTKDLVTTRFETALAHEEAMLALLYGYLDQLNLLIGSAIDWEEGTYDTTLFTALIARISSDLTSGATGLSPAVYQDIFDRELARQSIEDDKLDEEIEERLGPLGFDLPQGALTSALQEHANNRAMRILDMNQKITIDEANLAQSNSQFVIGIAKDVEVMLREFFNKVEDRSLTYATAIASLREKILEVMASLGMQSVASWAGATNASAGLHHSTGRTESESFTHGESRSVGYDKNNTLSESHQYEHDPEA